MELKKFSSTESRRVSGNGDMFVKREVSIVGDIILIGGMVGKGEEHGVDSLEALVGIFNASNGVMDSFR